MIYFFISNFLEYKWGMEAFMIAHDRMVNGRKDLLIVILKEKINVDRLPADLRPYLSKFLNLRLLYLTLFNLFEIYTY